MTIVSKPTSNAQPKTVVIVGAGVFGLSTALELAAKYPGWSITLVDLTPDSNRKAASHDISKIVRDDYSRSHLIPLARKAMEMWNKSPLYKPYFHKVSMIRVQPDSFSEDSLAAYEACGITTNARSMTTAEMRERWPVFETADLRGIKRAHYNPDYGFVEAEAALEAVRREVIRKGVKLVVGEVTRVALDEDGNCTGVALGDGREVRGTVLLCTGARTASLLVNSAPDRTDLHAGSRLRAASAISFTLSIEGKLREDFEDVPVFKNRSPGVMGESMSRLGNTLKFNCDMCFTNNSQHAATNQEMSLAPTDESLTEWVGEGIPEFLKQQAYSTLKGLYGDKLAGKKIKKYRICWDAITEDHDFIISAHPHCNGLFIATGGSFHGWKFFPVIGEYIAKMLDGKLDDEYSEPWAWDRPADGPAANSTYELVGDLGNLRDAGRLSQVLQDT